MSATGFLEADLFPLRSEEYMKIYLPQKSITNLKEIFPDNSTIKLFLPHLTNNQNKDEYFVTTTIINDQNVNHEKLSSHLIGAYKTYTEDRERLNFHKIVKHLNYTPELISGNEHRRLCRWWGNTFLVKRGFTFGLRQVGEQDVHILEVGKSADLHVYIFRRDQTTHLPKKQQLLNMNDRAIFACHTLESGFKYAVLSNIWYMLVAHRKLAFSLNVIHQELADKLFGLFKLINVRSSFVKLDSSELTNDSQSNDPIERIVENVEEFPDQEYSTNDSQLHGPMRRRKVESDEKLTLQKYSKNDSQSQGPMKKMRVERIEGSAVQEYSHKRPFKNLNEPGGSSDTTFSFTTVHKQADYPAFSHTDSPNAASSVAAAHSQVDSPDVPSFLAIIYRHPDSPHVTPCYVNFETVQVFSKLMKKYEKIPSINKEFFLKGLDMLLSSVCPEKQEKSVNGDGKQASHPPNS